MKKKGLNMSKRNILRLEKYDERKKKSKNE